MIVIDSSAIVAILNNEAEADDFSAMVLRHETIIGAPNVLETVMVLSREYQAQSSAQVNRFLAASAIAVVPFDETQLDMAAVAFLKYGKGRHPAGLNFGDCMAYALAKSMRLPLLFKGDDFALTDIERAV